MNNEIKELIFLLHNDRLTDSGKRKLENYITNLQQENERLKEGNKYLDELRSANYLSWQDSLSRIEKAVEYIERSIKESQLIFGWNDIQRYHDKEMNDLLNILNGRRDKKC